jgi:hypothetical protein
MAQAGEDGYGDVTAGRVEYGFEFLRIKKLVNFPYENDRGPGDGANVRHEVIMRLKAL